MEIQTENNLLVVPSSPVRGRPVGSSETPYNLVKQDLNQTLKLQKDVRNLVQEQIEEVKKSLKNKDMDLIGRLKAVEMLGTLMEVLSRSSQQTAKLILTPENEGGKKNADELDEQALIRELVGGQHR